MILIVVILSTLSLYLVFMLILEPFLASRGRKNLLDSAQPNLFIPSKTVRSFRSYVTPSQRVNDYGDLRECFSSLVWEIVSFLKKDLFLAWLLFLVPHLFVVMDSV